MEESEWPHLLAQLQQLAYNRRPSAHEQYTEVNEVLIQLVKGSMLLENRHSVGRDGIVALKDLFHALEATFLLPLPSSLQCSPLTEALGNTLKLSRNLCVGSPRNQDCFLEGITTTKAVSLASHLAMSSVLPSTGAFAVTPNSTILKTTVQFLGNLCVGHPGGQARVWSLCFPTVFQQLVAVGDGGVVDVMCMVLHTCTYANNDLRCTTVHRHSPYSVNTCTLCWHDWMQLSSSESTDLVAGILGCAAVTQSEWMTILLDSLLDSFCSLYKCLASHINAQIALLRYCSARLDSSSQHGGSELQDSVTTLKTKLAEEQNLAFLTTIFHSSTTKLLASPNMEALEEVLPDAAKDGHVCAQAKLCLSQLRLLLQFSQEEQWLAKLQENSRLLETAIALLKQLASLDGSLTSGKPRSSLRDTPPSTADAAAQPQPHDHLLYGAKRDLVRLIGNLAYKCPSLQNEVRNLEGISLILNQCSIDHRNPYISQWAIFTIHNLCEDNPANQAVIAALEQLCVSNAATAQEFGCEVEVGDDGRIKIKTKAAAPKQ